MLVAEDMLRTKREAIASAERRRCPARGVAATSSSATVTSSARSIPGLGIADLETVREPGQADRKRRDRDRPRRWTARAGRVREPRRPNRARSRRRALGRVLHGHGNNGRDGYEGVKRLNLIGTYLHGPLLPKNAWLADRLIALAIERRTRVPSRARAARDELEIAAHGGAAGGGERIGSRAW